MVRPGRRFPRDGGLMAAMFAATYPDRTSSLILGNSAACFSWAPDYPIGLPAEQQEMLIRLVEQTWGTGELITSTNPSLAQEPSDQAEAARFSRLAASPATAAAVFRTLLQLDIRPILPSIRVPTLVMHRRDTETWPIENGRYLAEHIEGPGSSSSRARTLPLAVGDVDPVVDEIQEFLTGTRAFVDTDRVLATVLFTDIVGSTERSAELGDQRWRDVLDAHDRLADRPACSIPRHAREGHRRRPACHVRRTRSGDPVCPRSSRWAPQPRRGDPWRSALRRDRAARPRCERPRRPYRGDGASGGAPRRGVGDADSQGPRGLGPRSPSSTVGHTPQGRSRRMAAVRGRRRIRGRAIALVASRVSA